MKNTLKLLLLFLIIQSFGGSLFAQEPGKHEFIVFDDKNFGGDYKKYDLSKMRGNFATDNWNNRISSIKVGKGLKLTLYNKPTGGLQGAKRVVMFEGGLDNLRRLNDIAKSYQLTIVKDNTPRVAFYDKGERRGTYQMLGPGKWNYDDLLFNDAISGVEAPNGTVVYLFNDANWEGNKGTIDGLGYFQNVTNATDMNDRTSSVNILELGYKIIKTVKGKAIPMSGISAYPKSGTNMTSRNRTNREQSTELKLSLEYVQSTTNTWNNATKAGITVSQEVRVQAGDGIFEVESTTSISATLENTFEFGKETTKETKKIYEVSINVSIKPGGRTQGEIYASKQKKSYPITYTYAPVILGPNGSLVISDKNHKEVTDIVIVDEVFNFDIDTYDVDQNGKKIIYNEPKKNIAQLVSNTNSISTLGVDIKLKTGDVMWSPQRKYQLKMQQDGNLCINTANDQFVWCTMSQSDNGAYAVLQTDGNFVVYDNKNTWKWDAQTHTLPSKPKKLFLDDDGNLKLLDQNNDTLKILNK